MKKILVFPCGSEIGLEIYRSFQYNKDYELIGGSSTSDHGKFVFENYIENIPFVDDEKFIDKINEIISEKKIDYLYPAHDSVVLKFAENCDKLKAKVVGSDYFTCDICRSKRKTYEFFKDTLLVPKIYEYDNKLDNFFPLFLKPDVGQGAKGTQKINNQYDLDYFYKDDSQLILEYLPFDEYTIDCFTDYKGNLRFCCGRRRSRISNGISVSSQLVFNDQFKSIAEIINNKLKFNGAWFFQLKENFNHELCLLEIAPRIAGTMEFQRAFGVNLALLNLYNLEEKNIDFLVNNYTCEMDRALSNNYKLNYLYNYIYIDLDDVIIQNGKVNYMVVSFLYKALSEKKKIILLTRHKSDPKQSLNQYKLFNIFSEIIHIKDESLKSAYIKHRDSIFIDDSHRERKDVYTNCGIPVFDVNMIDVLM